MVDDGQGTAATDLATDQETAAQAASSEAGETGASATQAGTEGSDQQTDAFLDNEELLKKIHGTPELDHFFKQMQGAYTKKMQRLSGSREAAELVQRFNTDPDFAKQTILQRAHQLGLRVGDATAPPTETTTGTVPAGLVDKIKAKLDPSLHWMAPQLAEAQWAAVQAAIQPMEDASRAKQQTDRQQQYETAAEALGVKAPGWEEHETDMLEMLTFLRAPEMNHRRFGSKLELLHRLVTGGAMARVEAAQRMASAARSKTTTGQAGRATTDNTSDQIRKAKTNREAWDIAKRVALDEAAKQGLEV